MSAKDVEVACPCCRSRLVVDVRTARVLRWSAPDEQEGPAGRRTEAADEARWESALSRAEGREGRGKSRFDEALERERSRERDLDDLFRDASEQANQDEPG